MADEQDECSVATNAAMEVALDECSDDGLMTNLSRMVGMKEPPEMNGPPDELDAADCMDMDVVRGWVVVRAHELIRDDVGLTDAIEQAWDEAGEECGW